MFKIHVLSVKFGDSIILETEVNSEIHFSIIDCKSIEGNAPTVEFLRERGIARIESIFLTHLHSDHYSGFPQLLDYLREVNGTLEYFVSPQLPEDYDIYRLILEVAHEETTGPQLTAALRAMNELVLLPSLTHPSKKAMPVRIVYEGPRGERSWNEQLHPALLFAPVNPSPQETSQLLRSAFDEAALHNKAVNAISHAFLIRFDAGCRMGLFTGDLEGKTWRFVKNRCLKMTTNAIRSELSFVKVPHHGAYNPHMEQCLQELIDEESSFVASISCPPGDPSHPDKRTLEFLKNNYTKCCTACTNISTLCHAKGFPSVPRELFQQSPGEAEFLQVASSDQFGSLQPPMPAACAGDHTITITGSNCTVQRSTGLTCSFNPSGCTNEHK